MAAHHICYPFYLTREVLRDLLLSLFCFFSIYLVSFLSLVSALDPVFSSVCPLVVHAPASAALLRFFNLAHLLTPLPLQPSGVVEAV